MAVLLSVLAGHPLLPAMAQGAESAVAQRECRRGPQPPRLVGCGWLRCVAPVVRRLANVSLRVCFF